MGKVRAPAPVAFFVSLGFLTICIAGSILCFFLADEWWVGFFPLAFGGFFVWNAIRCWIDWRR